MYTTTQIVSTIQTPTDSKTNYNMLADNQYISNMNSNGSEAGLYSQDLHMSKRTYSVSSQPATNIYRATSEQNISSGNQYLHNIFNEMYMGTPTSSTHGNSLEKMNANSLHRVQSSRSYTVPSNNNQPRSSQMTSMSAQHSPTEIEEGSALEEDIIASSQRMLEYLNNEKKTRLSLAYNNNEQSTHVHNHPPYGSIAPVVETSTIANQQQFQWPAIGAQNPDSDMTIPQHQHAPTQNQAVVALGGTNVAQMQQDVSPPLQRWNESSHGGVGNVQHPGQQQAQSHLKQRVHPNPESRQSLNYMYRSAYTPPMATRQPNSLATSLSQPGLAYSTIDLSKPPKRHRRRKSTLDLKFHCEIPGCQRKYASKLSRKQHYLLKHPTEKVEAK